MPNILERKEIAPDATKSFAYRAIYNASPVDRVSIIKAGVNARKVKHIIRELRMEQGVMLAALNLKVATINKKAAKNEPLSTEDGERVVGLAKLIGQLETMIEESGDPTGFDAPAWLSRWLREPLPAMGGGKPIDLLDTMEGQSIVSNALAQIGSGAYS